MKTRMTTIRLTERTDQQIQELSELFGNMATVITVAIDRLYQTERGEKTMSERAAVLIKIEYSEGSLFGGWEDMTSYDVEASMDRFGNLLQQKLQAEYPQAEIVIESGDDDWVVVYSPDQDGGVEEEIKIGVDEIIAEIYQDEDWAVEK
jgi:Arc/MetJ-type ribon-helix-helix transcriptional regulator